MVPWIFYPSANKLHIIHDPRLIYYSFPFTNYCQFTLWQHTYNHFFKLSIDITFGMPNRVTKASTLWPGKYSAMLAKTLEDEARAEKSAHHEDAIECQSESSGSTQTECEGALPGKDDQFGSRYGSKPLRKPDRETELVDSSPCRLYQPTNLANNRSVNNLNTMHFLCPLLINHV